MTNGEKIAQAKRVAATLTPDVLQQRLKDVQNKVRSGYKVPFNQALVEVYKEVLKARLYER